MSKEKEAREFLEKLEKDPKHRTRTEETDRQTKTDDLNDEKFRNNKPAKNPHKDDSNIDAGWHKDKQGNWTHPEFE